MVVWHSFYRWLRPSVSILSSFRRKVSPPQFETLNEFTDESDESKKNSPDEPVDLEHEAVERTDMKQPNPVDIGKYNVRTVCVYGYYLLWPTKHQFNMFKTNLL